jgi:hypothetical protein
LESLLQTDDDCGCLVGPIGQNQFDGTKDFLAVPFP